jgi:hypothetical protein
MVLGLVEGAEVVFLRRSLGGDPLEIRIYGAAISLREQQARRFHVVPNAGRAAGAEAMQAGAGMPEVEQRIEQLPGATTDGRAG